MITAIQLRKNYLRAHPNKFSGIGEKNGLSLQVGDGELFGVIGPDGAGKTTLFRILATLLLADSGLATMNGLDVVKDFKKIRDIIGYMPGRFSLYPDLSVEENLQFFATIFGTTIHENYNQIKDIYQQIEPFKTRRAGALSGGMKQKLALSCALIHKPEILILDEPTTGVDPVSRKEFWDILKSLKNQGITILVSTAYMDEASLCDRIALIREGEFIATDSPENIIRAYRETLWAVKADDMFALLQKLRKHPLVKSCFAFGETHHITVAQELSISELTRFLEQKGFRNIHIESIKPSVEDCFMALDTTNNTELISSKKDI